MTKRVPVEVYELAAKLLRYDTTSPSCLRWVEGRNAGKPAGCQDGKLYWLVRVGSRPGKLLRAHKIIWFIEHGSVPDLIDHKDGKPENNFISNLRPASESQNRVNAGKHKDSSSKVKNVYWEARKNYWFVSVMWKGKAHYGGSFLDKKDAENAAIDLRTKLHKDFANHD